MAEVRVGIPVTPEGLIKAVGERCDITVRFSGDGKKTARNVVVSAGMAFVPTFFIGGPVFATIAGVGVAVGVLVVDRKFAYKPLDDVVKTRFSPERVTELGLKIERYTRDYSCRTIDQIREELARGGALATTLARLVTAYLKETLGAVDVRHNCQVPEDNS